MIKLKDILNEAFGDLNDSGFKKIKSGFKNLGRVVKRLQVAVKKEDAKETIKSIRVLYDIAGIMYDMIGVPRFYESINERKLSSHQKKAILIAIEMSGNMTGATKKIEKIKKGLSNDNKVKDALRLANESVNEDIVRGNEVHAKTKRELKAAISKSMMEILKGKTPKYDIINGRTGEMIGWKDGKEYIWQPHAIPDAMRELK